MRLSSRTAWTEHTSALARARERLAAAGRSPIDLTISNPTAAGLVHPDRIYAALGDRASARYDPHPLGDPLARTAVVNDYRDRGVEVSPDRVWLCASTSEAYAHIFAIGCDPGDVVLVPRPGYPLLDVLGDVVSIRRVGYPLRYDGHWHIDLEALRTTIAQQPRARILVVVAPNNPTGNYVSAAELREIEALCQRHDLLLVVDAVFADYPLRDDPDRITHVPMTLRCPTLVLSGLSKTAALPQMKLSWVLVGGPDTEADALLARAEHVADAFLSVGTPVQVALPTLLEAAAPMRARIRRRLTTNLEALRHALAATPIELLDVAAGWTALLRLPAIADLDDEAWAVTILKAAGVVVQPGHLFDLPPPPRIAVSLLTEPRTFGPAVDDLIECVVSRT